MATAPAKGFQSDLPRQVHTQSHMASVPPGSTISASVRGKSNHLSRTVSLTSGVPRLTSATPSATHSSPQRAQATAFACSGPSVRSTSQVAPSST